MKTYTDCQLPELLEEAMQVIAVLRWRRPGNHPDVERAADHAMASLYEARRDAIAIGCRCCRRARYAERASNRMPPPELGAHRPG